MGGDLAKSIHARLEALAPEGGLGVAISGGGDSTALLLSAAEWAMKTGRVIEAATVDHGLRPESGDEAAGVANLCRKFCIPHEILHWRNQTQAGNPSAMAREARISLLGDWARRRDLTSIALGHNLDDQAETVLLRLARGAGVDGLSGMAARAVRDGVIWIRPLLEVRREDLRAYLRHMGLEWIDDPTNDDESYARIRMRKLIASSSDLDALGLAATASRLQGQRAALEWLAEDLAARALRWGGLGEAALDLVMMAQAPEDAGLRVVAKTLGSISVAAYRPKQTALAPLLAEMTEAESGSRTLSGCVIAWDRGVATICREPAAATDVREATAAQVWDSRWRIETDLAGVRIARLGEDGEAALAALRRRGVWEAPAEWRAAPRAARLASPALWAGDALAAAPLAGFGPARATLARAANGWRPSRRDDPFRGAKSDRDVT